MKSAKKIEVIDQILNYDPEDRSTEMVTATPQPLLMSIKNLPKINWDKKFIPKPKPLKIKPKKNSKLPNADVIIITWTVAEALALSDVLTPGYKSKLDWYEYSNNWRNHFKPLVKGGAPALVEDRLALWFPIQIGSKKVLCMKSELHFAKDGSKLPLLDFWKQLIQEVNPSLIITTGTAGGVGDKIQLGDVIITQKLRFDCTRTFKNAAFSDKTFVCDKKVKTNKIGWANSNLMKLTKDQLPEAKRQAKIFIKSGNGVSPMEIVTTDFFAFDDNTNFYKLQGLGSAVEMGDATLALACNQVGESAPQWVAIRNASDPQIGGNLTIKQKEDQAGRIYTKYGYWTTVNSAIASWGIVASL